MSEATTFDYVRFHAARRPHAAALVHGSRTFAYAEFRRDVAKFTQALRALGLAPGSSVAVEHRHPYVHWLLLLACEQLGLVSASFTAAEGDAAAPCSRMWIWC